VFADSKVETDYHVYKLRLSNDSFFVTSRLCVIARLILTFSKLVLGWTVLCLSVTKPRGWSFRVRPSLAS